MDEEISLFSSRPTKRSKTAKADSKQKLDNASHKTAPLNASNKHELLAQPEDKSTATFKELGLSEWLQKVCSGLGMKQPTAVQQGCVPAILQGRDVIGVAHTGSGKTAAFALPILQKLAKEPYGVFALVLTPTRELAFQLADQFKALGTGVSLKDCVVVGGLDMQQQAKELSRRPHVVIATPGRLKGLLDLDSALKSAFARTAFLVLDEADRLLEPSFENELAAILQCLPKKRQTLLFSATMAPSIAALRDGLLQDAFQFEAYTGLQTASQIKEEYLFIPVKVKEVYLVHLLKSLESNAVRSVIVFVSTCKGCEFLSALMAELEIPAAALHSNLPQKQRLASLDQFRSGVVPILLATDVGSRGLDIPTVDLVLNYDLPRLAKDYVHRVGRTGRAGRQGEAISFVSQHDIELLHKIEGLIGRQLEEYKCDENEVLKEITKVYAAKRTALVDVKKG